MQQFPDPATLYRAVQDEKARRSLIEFVRLYWEEVAPGEPFMDSWHIRAICEHLEAVSRGEIKNLLVNVPPGTGKSVLVSVMWPAWEWATNPALRFLGASYSDAISIRDATLCRNILHSDRYVQAYPDVRIRADENQKTHYGLTKGGWRIATSVGGRGTGLHPHRKIVDDPHNVKEAMSDAERESAVTWFDQTLASRGLILNAATVVIMQRLHQSDVSGHIMASANYRDWEHLVIPMEYEANRSYPVSRHGYKDPRTKDGELLWPTVFTRAKVDQLKVSLGLYGTSGQLQQRPSPAGGGILDVSFFKMWPASDPLPDLHFILQSYDTAFTDKTQNDPTACTVYGIFYVGPKKCVLLLEAWTEHFQYPQLRIRLMDDWKAEYGGIDKDPLHPSRRADVILVEEKGSGQSILQDLRAANVPVVAYNPGRADKTARAQMAAPMLEAGCFYVLESKKDKGQPIRWARPLLAQMEQFPNGEHDDLVDTFTQAAIYLRDAGLVEIQHIPDEEPEEIDYEKRKRSVSNPYFQ